MSMDVQGQDWLEPVYGQAEHTQVRAGFDPAGDADDGPVVLLEVGDTDCQRTAGIELTGTAADLLSNQLAELADRYRQARGI